MVQESDALAVLYTLGPPAADRPKLLIRCAWRQDSISADQLMQLLQQDGVDLNRVQCVRAMDPILHGWSLVGNTIPLVNAKQVEQPGSASPIRVLEVMVEELQFAQPAQMQMPPGSVPLIVPSNVSSFASYASYPACAPYANSSRTWEPSTPCPPLVQTPVAREPSLSERASSESLETVPSQAEAQSLGVFGQQTSFGTSSFGTSSVETTSMASHAQLLRRPREGAESLRRETMRQPHAVGDMQYVVPPHLVHNPGSFGVQLVPGSGIMHADRLELALLHAAPLVWRRGNMQVPLDHQSLSLDFKGEVKALLDVLGRVNKQIGVRFDVAASATLVEARTPRTHPS